MTEAVQMVPLGWAARVWWANLWRVVLVGTAVVIALILLLGVVGFGLVLVLGPVAVLLVFVLNYLLTLAGLAWVGARVKGIVFNRRYARFTVQLVDPQTGKVLPSMAGFKWRIWWSLLWRYLLVALVLSPIYFFTGGPEFQRSLQQRTAYVQCVQVISNYKSIANQPGKEAQIKRLAQQYQNIQCSKRLGRPKPALAVTNLFLAGNVLTLVIGLFAHFKIYQLMLQKRYRRFHIQVTEGA